MKRIEMGHKELLNSAVATAALAVACTTSGLALRSNSTHSPVRVRDRRVRRASRVSGECSFNTTRGVRKCPAISSPKLLNKTCGAQPEEHRNQRAPSGGFMLRKTLIRCSANCGLTTVSKQSGQTP